MEQEKSSYWLDRVLDLVEERVTKEVAGGVRSKADPVLVGSGITPSGPYHVGHAREILTGEVIFRGLKKRGYNAVHLHSVDAYDALRKRYPYLPESYEQEAGKPVYLVPAPDGEHESYADQYFSDYKEAADMLGVEMEVSWTQEEYQKGLFTDIIVETLQKRDQIAEILKRVSHREVEETWQPVQILDETNMSLRTAKFLSFDAGEKVVHYEAEDGTERVADMTKGQVKLDWRCDWPARWKLFGTTVEGFGKEHATKGGSYDTGKAILEEVYGGIAPIPVPYDTINLKGDNQKMSSSLGNLITIQDALKIIPPEILRYFVFRYLPTKQLDFDPGIGLYNLIDEVARVEDEGENAEFYNAWTLAKLQEDKSAVVAVPFSHLVELWQTARGDFELFLSFLAKTHKNVANEHKGVLEEEVKYIQNWLDKYAPENIKFSIVDSRPELDLNAEERDYLNKLYEALSEVDWVGDSVHNTIYETAKNMDLQIKSAFQILYKLFIGKDSGPKLGYFLATLDKEFVLNRISQEG